MMKFQMYVAKISKNHPSSTRFVGKKEKENPIIPFHDPFSLSTPNYRSVAVHRDPRAGIPSWKLSMHLQTWLLLSRHQIHQSILQWHRYRGRIRKVDDGEFPSFFFFSLCETLSQKFHPCIFYLSNYNCWKFYLQKKSVLMMIYLPFWIFEIQSNVLRRRNFIWKSVMKKKRKKMYKASFVRVKFYSENFENFYLYKLFKK